MPPKDDKLEKKEEKKAKNFFDLDDEDDAQEIAEQPQARAQSQGADISQSRLNELGATMRDLFHDDKDDDLFEENKEEPAEQQAEEKKTQITGKEALQNEFPHLFYDGGTALNDELKGSVPNPEHKEETKVEEAKIEDENAYEIEKTVTDAPEQKPVQASEKKKSLFGGDDDEEDDELEIVSNLDFLKEGKNAFQAPITQAEALDKLRNDVFTNKGVDITDDELDDEDELTSEDKIRYQMAYDQIKAAQPTPKPKAENTLGTVEFKIDNSKTLKEILTEDDDEELEATTETQETKKEATAEVNEKKDEAPTEKPTETAKAEEPKKINDSANVAVFLNQLNAFNKMYKLNITADEFAFSVTESWTMMKNDNEQKKADGKKMMSDLFKDTLKRAIDVEKDVSYDEHRLPDYSEIIKSSNELLRAAMFAFTDLYHDAKSASLFDPTAFGGMNEKDMAELTVGDSLWKMDQKSDDAWEIQSKEAKDIADKWLGESRPYETMINEMNALVEANKKSILERKDVLNKLAAAEWMLLNNEKMMVEDPEDPLNPIPNWGNRYWKALTSARESLGIDKHISMRELIQGDYAEAAKAASNVAYTRAQIKDYVMSPEARAVYDSMEVQKEQFATQSAAVVLSEPEKDKENDKERSSEERLMEELRVRISVKSEDQREIMKNEPKSYNFISEKTAEVKLDGIKNTPNA